jgi:sulfur-oxidizing protein SoxY
MLKSIQRLVLIVLVAVLPDVGVANEKAEPDPSKSQYWDAIRKITFGDREILDGKSVIRLYLTLRADDAATVPIAVKAQIDQTPERYIKSIYLIIERNPGPSAGVYHFTPESGRVQLETRLRFEDYSHVRAIAETNDGKLWMDTRWVKAAGGCSAPMSKFFVPPGLLGKMKFRFDDDRIQDNQPNLVQLMIRHPQESALAMDFDPNKIPQFVRNVKLTYGGKTIMDAEVDFSLSDNPTFRFNIVPKGEPAELKAEIEDTYDRKWEQSVTIVPGAKSPDL